MATDDWGNPQVDFVWGNMPLQPNHSDSNSPRWGESPYPGDGNAEYYTSPDAAIERQRNGEGMSNQLQAVDSHVIALRHWQNYPNFTAGDGFDLTVDWWAEGQPAYQYPNIVGLTVEEAVKQLKECGVNPAILVDLQFDSENPYDGITGSPALLNAPGANNPGVIIWRYMDPTTQLGNHWDGRPWYAAESDGKVMYTDYYPSNWVAVEEYEPGYFSYWHSFVVLQTTDPNKNSYAWWNW